MTYEPTVRLPDGAKESIDLAYSMQGYTSKNAYFRDAILDRTARDLGLSRAEVVRGDLASVEGDA